MRTLLIALLIAFATQALAQNFERGLAAYNRLDMQNAYKEFGPLAEMGHVEAQVYLGWMYARGEWVQKDHKLALHWFNKAARSGSSMAHMALGMQYSLGFGVPQDDVMAHMWNNIAAMNGERTGIIMRDGIGKRLTANGLETAQKLARDCVNSGYTDCGYQRDEYRKSTLLMIGAYLGLADYCSVYGVDFRELAARVIDGVLEQDDFDQEISKVNFLEALEKGQLGSLYSPQAGRYIALPSGRNEIFNACSAAHKEVLKISKLK